MARPANPTLRFKRLSAQAVTPTYATEGAACFDLTAIARTIKGNTATYSTGLAFEIPQGHVLLVYSRSGHGFKADMRLANAVGVVDSDYTGEVMVKLTYDGLDAPDWPWIGDRVAQAMLVKLPTVTLEETDELHATQRGANGFGSTGR